MPQSCQKERPGSLTDVREFILFPPRVQRLPELLVALIKDVKEDQTTLIYKRVFQQNLSTWEVKNSEGC